MISRSKLVFSNQEKKEARRQAEEEQAEKVKSVLDTRLYEWVVQFIRVGCSICNADYADLI